jgi:phosphonate transport system substrate-binding protein
MKLSTCSVLISMLMAGALLLSACRGGAETPTPEATEPPLPTQAPIPTGTTVLPTSTPVPGAATAEPKGSRKLPSRCNPLVISGVESLGPVLHPTVSELLAEETGYFVESPCFPNDADLLASLAAGAKPDAIVAPPQSYLVAHEDYGYEVALAGMQSGGDVVYAGEIIVGANTGIASLSDVAGKSVCWPSTSSMSGFKVPRLMLLAEGLNPQTDLGEETEAGSHAEVVRAVYLGYCEVGATYAGASETLADEFPDVLDKVLVIAESPPIPSVSLSFAAGVPEEVQAAVIAGYRAVAERDDGAEAVQMAYYWHGVEEADDSLFDPLRDLIDAAGMGIDALL